MNLKQLVHHILDSYSLPRYDTHGVGHWARVLNNGLRLAEQTGANVQVIQLFAVFHDSKRINEAIDPGHGLRGAEFATETRGTLFDLPDTEFKLLYDACAKHTDGATQDDVTIQTCWDADRLDLGRVGIYPDVERLCTAAAKQSEIIKWADGRACFEVIPEFVQDEWEIGNVA